MPPKQVPASVPCMLPITVGQFIFTVKPVLFSFRSRNFQETVFTTCYREKMAIIERGIPHNTGSFKQYIYD
jgi:hypothetical protein